LFSTCTLCCWRGLDTMIRSLLVYDWFYTCSTTSTTCLDYNPSRDRFQLDGFIDCSCTGGYLLHAWALGLAPPFCYDYLMLIIWLLARGAWCAKTLSVPQGTALMFSCQMLYNNLTVPDPREFLRSILGRCFVNHYFRDFISKQGVCSNYYPEDLVSHWLWAQKLIWEVILGVFGIIFV
jgi:hypothetical protein